MTKLASLLLISLVTSPAFSSEPVSFSINTKKWSHVLDDHFISITVNPTDLLQGKVYGLTMNSTMSILKGLAPAYVRIGSADTAKYTFRRNKYPSDVVKPDDEYTVTETHWMVFNEMVQSAGLDVIVCLNAAHRVEGTKKWDTRNSLELISFSDSQGYNLTWQLGYEIQAGDDLSGIQFGKDLNRLRTILNAFPRYQHSKLIGPDIRVIHKKEDVDFWNDVLIEAGPTLDAVTWHPRWPQPSKMKVSDNSELGYEFPVDYLEWDRNQLNKILQRSIFKNPIWIGESKRESTGTFAEGLIWAKRLVLSAKLGIEVVMKQPNLMDVTHPKPEYWIALLHKKLLGKAVLETRTVANMTDLAIISHCTNPYYWTDKPEKLQDGPITLYTVNMGGQEQKVQIKGISPGKSQLLFQYVLSSGSDPDSVFSQMTYLNGEPLMMTDDGMLPDIVPKIKKVQKGLSLKLPPYSIGFWVVPEAKVKICHVQPNSLPLNNVETLTPSTSHRSSQKDFANIENINQFIVEKLKNPESDSEEIPERNLKFEVGSSESSEKEINLAKENHLPRVARRIREAKNMEQINEELKKMMQETQDILMQPNTMNAMGQKIKLPKPFPSVERRIQNLAEGISDAIKSTNQQHEFDKFLEDSGLHQNFGNLLMNERRLNAPGALNMHFADPKTRADINTRLKRSILEDEESLGDEGIDNESSQDSAKLPLAFGDKISLMNDESEEGKDSKKPKDLVIPHQPDLKGLEEKYKTILQLKMEDGKRKIDDIVKKVKQEEEEIAKKSKAMQSEDINGLKKEIVMKEIELLQKTEDTVAEILDSQKKRQEMYKDILIDELDNVKEEKMTALREMYAKHGNNIVKRQVQESLTSPYLKTVKFIEKNFDLEPEGVKKIKRSLEEKMGEILRNYDVKKEAEIKKRMASIREYESEYDDLYETPGARKGRRTDEPRSTQTGKDRSKEKNYVRKHSTPSRPQQSSRNLRKYDSAHENSKEKETTRAVKRQEEPIYKSREKIRGEEEIPKIRKTFEKKSKSLDEEETSSYESLNSKKYQDRHHKYESKKVEEAAEEKPRKTLSYKDDYKQLKRTKNTQESDRRKAEKTDIRKNEKSEEDTKKEEEDNRETTKNFSTETKRIKKEENRREKMLKQISSMVENFNSLEKENGRSKRMNIDEDISLEFESDRRSRNLKRRPRQAEMDDFKSNQRIRLPVDDNKISEKVEQPIQTTATPVTSTTAVNKTGKSKSRRNRKRPNRKQKTETAEQNQEAQQKKRHLTQQAELPKASVDQEKKKVVKPKHRRINPKFIKFSSELPSESQNTIQEDKVAQAGSILSSPQETLPSVGQQNIGADAVVPLVEDAVNNLQKGKEIIEKEAKTSEQPEMPVIILSDKNKELLKDLEEFVEQKRFLDQASETSHDSLNTNGEKSSDRKNVDIDFSGETPEPTEGYIVVEPTVEGRAAADETQEVLTSLRPENDGKNIAQQKDDVEQEVDSFQKSKMSDLHSGKTPAEKEFVQSSGSLDKKDFYWDEQSSEDIINSEEMKMNPKIINREELNEEYYDTLSSNHRKRRSTSPTTQKKEEEKNDDDYSSEERIQKFKQMIYKTSPARKATKNDIRSTSSGMGADEFLRMAGSTVRVVFDDVIPEAYGQTKDKIQNMGISEYIKEFGKLVQQMRNLDQIFLNIGEAAVKGYIKGNKPDKGPYIQVISRKKRSLTGDDIPNDQPTSSESSKTAKNPEDIISENTEEAHITTSSKESADRKASPELTSIVDSHQIERKKNPKAEAKRAELSETKSLSMQHDNESDSKYARTDKTETTAAAKRGDNWSSDSIGQWHRKDAHRWNHQGKKQAKEEKEKAAEPFSAKIEKPKHEISQVETSKNKEHRADVTDDAEITKQKEVKGTTKPSKSKVSRGDELLGSTGIVEPIVHNFREEITPWIKTTEDFIQQALTTLQRQKQLTDILAKDGISMMKQSLDKNIEKRETGSDETAVSSKTSKRETDFQTNESVIRKLRGLAPGVYVVPTAEMTNIRSEQITNEAKQKSGLPNVVTLNIYYDKKNQETSAKIEENQEPRTNQEVMSYYQNDPWNPVVSQYDQNNQYVSPMGMPELRSSVVSPLQVNPLYTTGPRAAELPNPPLMQYPPANYHYPVPQRVLPPVVARSSQPVISPVVYLQPENSFLPQPPGTKGQWRNFRLSGAGAPSSDGWNLQYKTASKNKSSKTKVPSTSYNTNFKIFSDKKRSVDDGKVETSPESPLPFWKFFATASSEGNVDKFQDQESDERNESGSMEVYSSEDVYTDKVKDTNEIKEKKTKVGDMEENATALKNEEEVKDKPKSRSRRSLSETHGNEISGESQPRNLAKRSYRIQFGDHDVLPQWYAGYQGVENGLEEYPQQPARSQVISTSLVDDDEELLSAILNAEDELSLLGVDEDNYFYNDNALAHLRRYPRSTNNLDSAMIKTNMIYKTPMDGDLPMQKMLDKTAMKNLMNEDSSLELVTKSKHFYSTVNPVELQLMQNLQQQQQQLPQLQQQPKQPQLPQQPQQQQPQQQQNYQQPLSLQPANTAQSTQQQVLLQVQPKFAQNGTILLPSNPNDDAFYFFFKYAYDSFLKMMKSMSQLF